MDRFLDDNESAASSRASSPHNFTGRSRVGNGYLPNQSSSTSSMQTTVHSVPSGSSHTTVSMMSGATSHHSHHNHHHHAQASNHGATMLSPGKPPQLLQHCVPTSVIVSSNESPAKRPRMDHDNIPRLINTTISKPPPLKPIGSLIQSSSVHKGYGDRSHIGESASLHRPQVSTNTDTISRVTVSESFHHKA